MFENSIVKRRVQSILFNGIKVPSMVGLAGPNPEDYVEIIKQHAEKVNLCDYEPSRKYVTKNSLIGMYQLVKPKWVDADFCSSWVSNHLDTWYLYNSLKETGGILTVTFSTHTGRKDAEMFLALKGIFGIDLSKAEKVECITFPKLGGKEYIHIYEPVGNITMIKYRDSGDNMICLKVIISSRTSRVEPQKEVLEKKNARQCMHTETAKKIFDKILEKYEFSEDGVVLTAAQMSNVVGVKPRQIGGALSIVLDPKYIISSPGLARMYKVRRK